MRQSSQKKRIISVAAALLMAFSMSACKSPQTPASSSQAAGGSSSATAQSSKPAENQAPKEITWMSILHSDSPPSDEVIQAINELANVKLTFNWIPAAARAEKMNSALASGKLADIVTIVDLKNATNQGALASGMFWDIEPYLKDYPNLAAVSEDRIDSVRVNGKLYGVPMVKPVARYGVVIRQDWLDNLGLEVPHTFEDLMEVAIAFTTLDPDGNGIPGDTYGIADREESFLLGFRMVAGWHGASAYFGLNEDGVIRPWFFDEGYFKAMEAYRYLYENGAINSDFAVMTKNDQQQAIAQSKAGIVITGLMDTRNYVNLANDIGMGEKMVWTQINDMSANGNPRRILSDTGNGVGGLYAMPKSYVKTEDDLRACLEFLDKVASEEGFMLFSNGIEGKHYDVIDGVVTIKDDTVWKQEVQALNSSRVNELLAYNYKTSNEILNLSNKLMLENEEYAVYDISLGLTSETHTTLWSQLLDIPKDAYFKYVMGSITMDDVHKANERWLAQGGQAIIDELTADYHNIYG